MLAHYLQGFSLQLGLELYLVGYRHRLTDFTEKVAETVRIVVTFSSDIGTVQGSDTTDTYSFTDTSPGIKNFVVDGKSPLPPQPKA
jgi:Tfp pilus assembly protein PilO